MGKPELELPPEERERPWPIDPRPAIRDLREFFNVPPFRKQTPRERNWAIVGGVVIVSLAITRYWTNRILHPYHPPPYVAREKLLQVEKGMSQNEVRRILGEPASKAPDCWIYNYSDDQFVRIHFGSMFKVTVIESEKKRLRDSER
jgi:hypothetical protein